jgi:hypothetical protein
MVVVARCGLGLCNEHPGSFSKPPGASFGIGPTLSKCRSKSLRDPASAGVGFLGRFGQLLDLVGRQVLARAQLCVGGASRVTVKFSVVGATSRRFGFAMVCALPSIATVQTLGIF